MKIHVLDINGKKAKEITTDLFEEPIREDIIFKVLEAQKEKLPYSSYYYAGVQHSAAGTVRHKRHAWKVSYGRGMSRIARKTMSRKGTQFSWVGAYSPNTRGGRRALPPRGIYRIKKINKKEIRKALLSALSYIADSNEVKKKYARLKDKEIKIKLPIVVEDKILKLKTKQFFESLKNILNELMEVAIQKKSVRAGIGKLRGRRYKQNAGLLFVIGKNESIKISGIEVIKTNKLKVEDLASGGARLCMFTEQAIKELENKNIESKK